MIKGILIEHYRWVEFAIDAGAKINGDDNFRGFFFVCRKNTKKNALIGRLFASPTHIDMAKCTYVFTSVTPGGGHTINAACCCLQSFIVLLFIQPCHTLVFKLVVVSASSVFPIAVGWYSFVFYWHFYVVLSSFTFPVHCSACFIWMLSPCLL